MQIQVQRNWKTFISCSLLYLQAKETGTDLASVRQLTPSKQASMVPMEEDFHLGFKLDAGIRMSHDHWNIFFEYLRYHGSNHRSVIADANTYLNPLWMDNSNFEGAGNAKGEWKVKIDEMLLLLERPYLVGKQLTLTAQAGFKGGWINQRYNAIYHYAEESNVILESRNRSRSYMFGPATAVLIDYYFGKGFSIYGKGLLAILWQRFRTTTKQDYTETELHTNMKNILSALTPNFQLEAGVKWSRFFNYQNWHFNLFLGYQFSTYFNQNQMRALKDNVSSRISKEPNALTTQGLIVSVWLDF